MTMPETPQDTPQGRDELRALAEQATLGMRRRAANRLLDEVAAHFDLIDAQAADLDAERERADAAEARLRDLASMLREATESETEPCRLDHNGDCQEHGYFGGPCLIPRARAALATHPTAPETGEASR